MSRDPNERGPAPGGQGPVADRGADVRREHEPVLDEAHAGDADRQSADRRAAERAEQEKKAAEASERQLQLAKACTDAQGDILSLESGQRISRINAAGEREFLSDAERAERLKNARRSVSERC